MSEAKVEVLKTVIALAWADGELSESEQRLVDFLIDTGGFSEQEQETIRAQSSAEVDLERLGSVVTEERDRVWAYEVASLVSQMDGTQDPEEWALLGKLKPVLKVDEEAAKAAEERAKTIYGKFAAHQAGDPEDGEGAS